MNTVHSIKISFRLFTAIITLSTSIIIAQEQSFEFDTSQSFIKPLSREAQHDLYQSVVPPRRVQAPVITPSKPAWKELEIDLLTKTIERTTLASGACEFKRLVQPTSNIEELERRRAILNELIENRALFVEIDNLLRSLAPYEQLLFQLYVPTDPVTFGSSPESIINTLNHMSIRWSLAIQSFTAALLIQSMAYEARHIRYDLGNIRESGWLKKLWLFPNFLANGAGLAYGSYVTGSSIKSTLSQIPLIDAYMLLTAQTFGTIAIIAQELKKSPSLLQANFTYKLDRFFNFSVPQKQELIDLMDFFTSRMEAESNSSILATPMRWWRMLDSMGYYDTLLQFREFFLPLIQALGELDAYMSIVRYKDELEAKGMPVTLAQFIKTERPFCQFTNIINPLVSDPVPNGLTLGDPQAAHAVITGPHGCGKTTYQKTIAYGHILGQSILLVPAQTAVFSPVTRIDTYLNITDNLSEGMSSFMAEQHRMIELNKMARSLNLDERCLMIIDEPYAKTIQQIGEPRVAEFLSNVSEIPQLMVILATHFQKPAMLEGTTQGRIKNFQPELNDLPDGSFERTFKILPGAAEWWFTNEARREAFIDWLASTYKPSEVEFNDIDFDDFLQKALSELMKTA